MSSRIPHFNAILCDFFKFGIFSGNGRKTAPLQAKLGAAPLRLFLAPLRSIAPLRSAALTHIHPLNERTQTFLSVFYLTNPSVRPTGSVSCLLYVYIYIHRSQFAIDGKKEMAKGNRKMVDAAINLMTSEQDKCVQVAKRRIGRISASKFAVVSGATPDGGPSNAAPSIVVVGYSVDSILCEYWEG